MTRLQLLERTLRISCFTILGILLALVLTACGPGSGGTGTGPQSFSTTAATTAGGATPGLPGGVTNPAAPGRVDLQLQDRSVEAASACGRFVFNGGWELDAALQASLPGTWQAAATGAVVSATLQLQFSGPPDSAEFVTLTVLNDTGGVLLGPRTLGRVANVAETPPAGCTP
jgi:hypothetical protein